MKARSNAQDGIGLKDWSGEVDAARRQETGTNLDRVDKCIAEVHCYLEME